MLENQPSAISIFFLIFFFCSLEFFLLRLHSHPTFSFHYFSCLEEVQQPHVFDYLRTKHHQHYIREARDNQTMQQHLHVYVLLAVLSLSLALSHRQELDDGIVVIVVLLFV